MTGVPSSQPMSTEEEIAILQDGGDRAVQNRNYWQEEAERRAEDIAALVKALEAVEFRGHQGKCPLCAGWMMSAYGETPGVHTKDCLIGAALSHRGTKT